MLLACSELVFHNSYKTQITTDNPVEIPQSTKLMTAAWYPKNTKNGKFLIGLLFANAYLQDTKHIGQKSLHIL